MNEPPTSGLGPTGNGHGGQDGHHGRDGQDARLEAVRFALQLVAREIAVAERLQGEVRTALLQSVVDAAAALFDAQAASIAVFEPENDHLVFRVAAGEQGAAILGVSVPSGMGIVGHVLRTAEPVAIADVASDPRFDRGTAQRTGYLPRSLAAAPLVGPGGPLGVLQVLDKRNRAAFSPRDLELLGVFARQAAAALEAPGADPKPGRLLRDAISTGPSGPLDEHAVHAIVIAAEGRQGEEPAFWRLVDEVARWRGRPEADVTLISDLLAVMGRPPDG